MRLSESSYFLAFLAVILFQHLWYVRQLDGLQKGSSQAISIKCECPSKPTEEISTEDLEVMCAEIEDLGYVPSC